MITGKLIAQRSDFQLWFGQRKLPLSGLRKFKYCRAEAEVKASARSDGFNGPQVVPPAYGLKGIHRITSTGDGEDLAYWSRYVGVTQIGGHGTFSEPRTGVNVTNGTDDLISAKLPALQAYQLTLTANRCEMARPGRRIALRGNLHGFCRRQPSGRNLQLPTHQLGINRHSLKMRAELPFRQFGKLTPVVFLRWELAPLRPESFRCRTHDGP